MRIVQPPAEGDHWVGLTEEPLPVEEAGAWAVLARCGAVVSFSGTARDHSEDRPEVTMLTYEAYEEEVTPRLEAIAEAAHRRWPDLGRVAILHRVGPVQIGESSVVIAVSAPHRGEAFDAARFCIDTLKATVPIWKREHWPGGSDWARQCEHVAEVEA